MNMQLEARRAIQDLRVVIDRAYGEIEHVAQRFIPDYHFLNYRVSTFWTCDASPIGMCLFVLDDRGHATVCRYCGGPEERK